MCTCTALGHRWTYWQLLNVFLFYYLFYLFYLLFYSFLLYYFSPRMGCPMIVKLSLQSLFTQYVFRTPPFSISLQPLKNTNFDLTPYQQDLYEKCLETGEQTFYYILRKWGRTLVGEVHAVPLGVALSLPLSCWSGYW